MNEILTVHPRQYRDAQAIAEHFREGIADHHQPPADDGGRRASPHRLRQRPLAGPLRQDRAGHQQGVPAVARARRRLGRDTARTARSTPPSPGLAVAACACRPPPARVGRPAILISVSPIALSLPCLLRAAVYFFIALGAVRARSRARLQPILASARIRPGARRGDYIADRSADQALPPPHAAAARRAFAIDFGWSLTMLAVIILMYVTVAAAGRLTSEARPRGSGALPAAFGDTPSGCRGHRLEARLVASVVHAPVSQSRSEGGLPWRLLRKMLSTSGSNRRSSVRATTRTRSTTSSMRSSSSSAASNQENEELQQRLVASDSRIAELQRCGAQARPCRRPASSLARLLRLPQQQVVSCHPHRRRSTRSRIDADPKHEQPAAARSPAPRGARA